MRCNHLHATTRRRRRKWARRHQGSQSGPLRAASWSMPCRWGYVSGLPCPRRPRCRPCRHQPSAARSRQPSPRVVASSPTALPLLACPAALSCPFCLQPPGRSSRPPCLSHRALLAPGRRTAVLTDEAGIITASWSAARPGRATADGVGSRAVGGRGGGEGERGATGEGRRRLEQHLRLCLAAGGRSWWPRFRDRLTEAKGNPSLFSGMVGGGFLGDASRPASKGSCATEIIMLRWTRFDSQTRHDLHGNSSPPPPTCPFRPISSKHPNKLPPHPSLNPRPSHSPAPSSNPLSSTLPLLTHPTPLSPSPAAIHNRPNTS